MNETTVDSRFSASTGRTVKIRPKGRGFNVDAADLRTYRELFFFMVWRDIKARYAQSVLGVGWAVIQPVMSMVIFSIVFGGLAEIRSDGVPYPLFSLAALVPWTYFSSAVIDSTGGLVKNANMLQKVYFPRLIIPLAAVLGRLVDFVIAFCLLLIMMFAFGWFFTPGVLILPVLILTMMIGAAGMGMWLSALSVQYRDINYGMGFALQLLMYVSPVVYPVSLVAEKAGAYSFIVWIYALNPMVGVIQGFRSALLGTVPLPWDLIAIGGASALFLAVSGMLYFLNREHLFADVV